MAYNSNHEDKYCKNQARAETKRLDIRGLWKRVKTQAKQAICLVSHPARKKRSVNTGISWGVES